MEYDDDKVVMAWIIIYNIKPHINDHEVELFHIHPGPSFLHFGTWTICPNLNHDYFIKILKFC
jgi:hypothetical protein